MAYRYLTFIMAPEITVEELDLMQREIEKSIADPQYVSVFNYEIGIHTVNYDPAISILYIYSPTLDDAARKELQEFVNDPETKVIYTNHAIATEVISLTTLGELV